MKNFIQIATFLLFPILLYSQEDRNSIRDKILTHLYQDDIINFLDKSGKIVKYDFSLLDLIDIDFTLMKYESSNYVDIDFYKFDINDIRMGVKNDSVNLSVNDIFPKCNTFILGINLSEFHNYTYRLKGFSTNDILYLLHDLSVNEKSDLKMKAIVKEMDVIFEDIDIQCMYKSIKKMKLDSECIKSNCYRRRPNFLY